MKTAFAVSAALLLAGTAYVLPAHAQTAPQPQRGAPQTPSQSYRSGAHTQPYAPTQTQSGTTAPSQTQSFGASGNQMGGSGAAGFLPQQLQRRQSAERHVGRLLPEA